MPSPMIPFVAMTSTTPPAWQSKLLMAAGFAICMGGGWALHHLLPVRFQRVVANSMMILGGLVFLSCLFRSSEIIEPSPTADAIFISFFLGGPLLVGMGAYLSKQVTGTD